MLHFSKIRIRAHALGMSRVRDLHFLLNSLVYSLEYKPCKLFCMSPTIISSMPAVSLVVGLKCLAVFQPDAQEWRKSSFFKVVCFFSSVLCSLINFHNTWRFPHPGHDVLPFFGSWVSCPCPCHRWWVFWYQNPQTSTVCWSRLIYVRKLVCFAHCTAKARLRTKRPFTPR